MVRHLEHGGVVVLEVVGGPLRGLQRRNPGPGGAAISRVLNKEVRPALAAPGLREALVVVGCKEEPGGGGAASSVVREELQQVHLCVGVLGCCGLGGGPRASVVVGPGAIGPALAGAEEHQEAAAVDVAADRGGGGDSGDRPLIEVGPGGRDALLAVVLRRRCWFVWTPGCSFVLGDQDPGIVAGCEGLAGGRELPALAPVGED